MKNKNYTNKNVKYLRESHGITQSKMASDLKINQSTLAKWENGSIQITLEWALKLADYFDLDVGTFISKELLHQGENMKNFFYSNLKYLRKYKGMSQQEIADKIGIDRSSISRWENGDMGATIDKAIDIAQLFDIPISKFLYKDLSLNNKENKV